MSTLQNNKGRNRFSHSVCVLYKTQSENSENTSSTLGDFDSWFDTIHSCIFLEVQRGYNYCLYQRNFARKGAPEADGGCLSADGCWREACGVEELGDSLDEQVAQTREELEVALLEGAQQKGHRALEQRSRVLHAWALRRRVLLLWVGAGAGTRAAGWGALHWERVVLLEQGARRLRRWSRRSGAVVQHWCVCGGRLAVSYFHLMLRLHTFGNEFVRFFFVAN